MVLLKRTGMIVIELQPRHPPALPASVTVFGDAAVAWDSFCTSSYNHDIHQRCQLQLRCSAQTQGQISRLHKLYFFFVRGLKLIKDTSSSSVCLNVEHLQLHRIAFICVIRASTAFSRTAHFRHTSKERFLSSQKSFANAFRFCST
jgi:hypothetical protein